MCRSSDFYIFTFKYKKKIKIYTAYIIFIITYYMQRIKIPIVIFVIVRII